MTSGGVSYQWSGPNGYTSNLQNPIINNATIQNTGAYTVTVTAAGGCTGTSSVSVIVNPIPTMTSTSNSPVCTGNPINLMASGGNAYQWSGPNGFTSNLQNPVINNAANQNGGTYTVTVTAAGGCTGTQTTNMVIRPNPMAIISSNSPVCNGGNITFQLSGGVSYLWQGPDNFTSIAQNPSISNANPANNGTYTVLVTGQNGCTTSASTIVNVTDQLNVTVSSNSPICEGDTLRLMANGGINFVWNGPNGFTSSLQNPTISLTNDSSNGNYVLTVNDVSGCTGTRQVIVEVKQKPLAIITGDQEICQGEEVSLQTPTSGTLLWSTNAITSSITVRPILNTTYTLIADMNGCKDSTSYLVTVSPKPILNINVTNATVSSGESIQLMATGAKVYTWTQGTGLSCTDCFDPVAKPVETTIYCVNGILNGCSADTCINITVIEDCFLIFPNIFSPNDDNNNDTWCSLKRTCIVMQQLQIYDRWGNQLYNQSGEEVCWDGKIGGIACQNNVYTFLLQMVKSDGKIENRSGSIALVK